MKRKQYRFKKSMLNGHPGNINRACKRVIVRAVNAGLVVTSTTSGLHAPTSYHYKGRAVDIGVPSSIAGTPAHRAKVQDFQRFLLNKFGPAWFAELFGPDDRANVKNGVRLTLLHGSSLERLHEDHDHIVPYKMTLPRPSRAVRDARLARRARKAGARYERRIIREARRAGIDIPLAFALIEQESGFRNVYGHDAVRNPALKGGKVTRRNYAKYLKARRAGLGMQGVGPAQLTWYELQNEADRLGGCWKVTPNLRVAFSHLAALIKAYGERDGIRRYNGSGDAAERYAVEVLRKRAGWRRKLR